MSDLPPPPSPPSGWPQQGPQQPQPGQWPGQAPGAPSGPGYGGGYGAPPAPPGQGPWGSPANYGYGGQAGPGYAAQKAGFWQRFVASVIIDGIIVGLFLVPAYVALIAGPKDTEPCFVDSSGDIDPFEDDFNNAICEVPSGSAWAMFGVLFIAGFAGALVYYAQMQGKTGQTVGYKAMNIKLVDIQTGLPVGPGRAIGRYFARWISGIVCYLGYLWMLWDPQKQTWHDKMTSSVVVNT